MKRAQIDHAACAETPGSDPSNNIGALSREPYSMMPSPAAQHMDIPQEQGKQRWGSSMRPINAERNVAPGLQEVKSPGGRRETINEHINELAKIVPGCEKNKGSILKLAVQFITQLKENERQNIEKRGLEKCLTNEVITKLTASCYKFQAESQRAWDECQIYKRACENNGILPDEIKDRQENGEGAGRPDAARASSTQQSGRPEDEMSHLKRKRQSRSDDQALDSIMMPVEFGIPRWDDELREQAKEAHGIEHHSVEPEDEGTHLEKRYKSVKPSGHTKGRLNPSMSTKAQDTLLRFIQQFVKMVGKSSGTQCAHDSTIMLRPSISDEDYLKDALQIHASRLLSISAAAVNTSTGVKRKEATLTLYGAVLIEHYSVLIAHYLIMSIFHNTSPKVSHKDYLLQSMAPPDFSPERLGLTESSLMAVEDGVQSYLPDVFLDYFKGNMTNAELDVIVRLLESDEEIQLLALCSRFGLRRDDSSAMQIVESMMSEKSLPHVESQGYKAVFELTSWSITDFMQDQFGEDIAQPGSVVTLTGTSTLHVQASTCADYIKMTWPHTGSFFLELLEAVHTTMMNTMKVVLPNPKPILLRSDQGLQVNVNCMGPWGIVPYFEGHATDKSLLVQLGQQLSWMGSAFTVSPFRNRMAHSSPTFLRTRQGEFQISFRYNEIDESEKACWLPLFDGACIVAGFPISARAEEIGLEISLDLLAGLSGARHVFEYEGGLVMKGFSHMFVPVRRQLDRVQWHAVSSLDRETPLSYNDGILRCASRAMLDEVSLQDLASLRAIVGWCSQATTCLGSSHADYGNIDYTKADEANSGPRCTGTSFGFQQFGMAALDVKFGLKDGKSHFQRTGPYRRIIALAEKSPIVLHDVEEKRSWLVPATNVMLHIVQHRHHLNPFQVNGNPIILDTDIVTGWLAGMVLLKNRTQVLYDDDNYTFMDDILNTWSILEFLLAQNLTRQREAPGVRIPSSLHESLYGFEFKAVVQQDAPYNLKKTTISRNHGGWLKLIEDIDALVLFANGFGDVILPVSASKEDLCRKWKSVPHGQDYLATTTHMLQTLFDRAGSRVDRKYLTTKSKLRWHQGSSALFNECQDVTTCDCTRLQQLIPESAIKSAQTPTSIADEGAVIFGHPEPRSAPVRSTVSKISSSLYSQPNVPILPRIVRRRSGTNDERKGKIRRLDIEAGELSCKHKHRPQAMS